VQLKLKVNEILASIQGEGTNAGATAVFLRTALCNLKCVWCDSRYTWDFATYPYEEEVHEITVREAAKRIKRLNRSHVVITGGEPLLQQRDLTELAALLKEAGYYIEVETNGTIIPHPALTKHVDQWNVSPKLASSRNPRKLREKPNVYTFFANQPNAWFKFVVAGEGDVRQVLTLVTRYKLPKHRVLLMPEAATRRKLVERSRLVADLCVKHGFRFSPRLQIELWDGRRGT